VQRDGAVNAPDQGLVRDARRYAAIKGNLAREIRDTTPP
jgi:hypothetical protein